MEESTGVKVYTAREVRVFDVLSAASGRQGPHEVALATVKLVLWQPNTLPLTRARSELVALAEALRALGPATELWAYQ